ncbi:hypothetical protein, unlikely [Trypanosoma brucei gambiense DAL972]|uniref:Uncharacterized protein n=1 Tax=Trypanosoma brucei gambiense (strain MHOM/CI/86/DAL972) TaxID=679716 RepID=C9ZM98_TRYB9|nr:hypothetical protein, unlikely [Trypanosoma brucei gambiense DAL972]CBH10771.1 hypothetical protein, unlikely [Trypanosoma brucei gambiense DAL972]|eukprot:XP_011773059.1 hypothetical protein, unlikely [Trypanosoma brucei gambiense DAL972]
MLRGNTSLPELYTQTHTHTHSFSLSLSACFFEWVNEWQREYLVGWLWGLTQPHSDDNLSVCSFSLLIHSRLWFCVIIFPLIVSCRLRPVPSPCTLVFRNFLFCFQLLLFGPVPQDFACSSFY